MLSRQEMIKEIRDGRSVSLKGVVYTNIADLPSEAELAAGDPVKEAAVKADLQLQIEQLYAELKSLQKDDVKAEAKDDAKTVKKDKNAVTDVVPAV